MKLPENFRIYAALAAFGVVVVLVIFRLSDTNRTKIVDVTVPALSELAAQGEAQFETNCASCHGLNAAGTDKGPPLVHDIYNPGHHADAAFVIAVKRGVPQHHWPYGSMPPQPQVSDIQVALIVRYIRELQIANGIQYRRHQM